MGDYDATCLKGWFVLLDNWILNSFFQLSLYTLKIQIGVVVIQSL